MNAGSDGLEPHPVAPVSATRTHTRVGRDNVNGMNVSRDALSMSGQSKSALSNAAGAVPNVPVTLAMRPLMSGGGPESVPSSTAVSVWFIHGVAPTPGLACGNRRRTGSWPVPLTYSALIVTSCVAGFTIV